MNAYSTWNLFKCLPAHCWTVQREKHFRVTPYCSFSVSSSCALCLSEVTLCYFYHFIAFVISGSILSSEVERFAPSDALFIYWKWRGRESQGKLSLWNIRDDGRKKKEEKKALKTADWRSPRRNVITGGILCGIVKKMRESEREQSIKTSADSQNAVQAL